MENETKLYDKKSEDIYNFIQEISDIYNSIIKKYFNNNKDEEYNFYLKNYNETKYIYDSPLSNDKKNINFKYLLDGNIKSHCFKYKPISFGYYESYELYYSDILKLNNKNISIAEITILPTFFEVLKDYNVDVYLTKINFRNLDEKNWKNLINFYKKTIDNNFYYDIEIKKKYDLLILNLIPDKKDKNMTYEDYIINNIKIYIKKQID